MKLTSALFEAYLKCPTKCHLLSTGQTGVGNAYAEWVREKKDAYRKEAAHRLVAATGDGVAATTPRADNLKNASWRLALDLPLETETMASRLHAVERVPSQGRGKAAQFVPIRFVFRNKLTKDDRLVLAFDALVLSQVLGREIGLGKIIHGDVQATLKVKVASLSGTVRKLAETMPEILAGATPPDLILNRHCGECEFRDGCHQKAVAKDDLSLLRGMSAKERQKLQSKGIFTVTQLSYTFRPRRRPKRQRDRSEKYHHSLKALAIREKKLHIVGSPELKIDGTPVYLDVEGLPDRDFYYLIGLRVGDGASAVQHSLWADTVEDEGKIWREFLGILETLEKPVLIHYGSYETSFLKSLSKRYGSPEDDSVAAKAFGSALNLVSVMFAKAYFPTYSNSLKEIARHLHFEWSEADAAGTSSIAWRLEWEKSHAALLMRKLLTYNIEDCVALARVHGRLGGLSVNGGKANHSVDFVHAESLPRNFPCIFKRNQFQFTEFEQINQAAYWDYQREKVLVKSNERLKKTAHRVATKRRLKPRVNKTIDWPRPTICPKCDGLTIYKHQTATKTVIDVRFGSGSVKKWATNYRFHYFRCPTCRAVFRNPNRTWDGQKFGPNLRAFSVYQNIELRLPQHQVAAFLNSVLDFQLSATMVNRFKENAAAFYQSTHEAMLRSIVSGPLVHVDETMIKLGGQACYVWVFTNLEEAVYVYSQSREGELVQRVLKDFNGVLVSDFYAAYDSLNCAQQKCLIHLIRDLNEDLYKEPFNTEFKELVGEFAALLKPMIETIDRFGLKTRFLRRHKREVDRFFRRLSRRAYASELALKCQQRLQKNRESLFTFLDHDDIPWNNNNAEHAVKAFALLRRNLDGVSTEKGIKEYLILLSVCQTCKCVGVDFLDFLRSGEKDIHAFAESRRRRRSTPNEPKALLADE